MDINQRNKEILAEYEGGKKPRELARKYGLSYHTIRRIVATERSLQAYPETRTNWDRDFKETVVLMRKYGVPVNPKTNRRCFDMTERAIRLLGKYYKDKEYYEAFGDPV